MWRASLAGCGCGNTGLGWRTTAATGGKRSFSFFSSFCWMGTGIRGNSDENHSNLVRNARSISPTVITWPPPAFTSISCNWNKWNIMIRTIWHTQFKLSETDSNVQQCISGGSYWIIYTQQCAIYIYQLRAWHNIQHNSPCSYPDTHRKISLADFTNWSCSNPYY